MHALLTSPGGYLNPNLKNNSTCAQRLQGSFTTGQKSKLSVETEAFHNLEIPEIPPHAVLSYPIRIPISIPFGYCSLALTLIVRSNLDRQS